jgi:aminopeptidase N
MAALTTLANLDCPERQPALDAFYAKWKDEPLVVDKWLAVQAGSRLPTTLHTVRQLQKHPAFDLKVPNKVYALLRTFGANHVRFHAADGGGYEFLSDQIIALNALNPQIAARMARSFDRWRKFDQARQAKAQEALERIRSTEKLSSDVGEIVGKALA